MTLHWALFAIPQEAGIAIGGVPYQCLAFTDDVVLLAFSPTGLRKIVSAVVETAKLLGHPGDSGGWKTEARYHEKTELQVGQSSLDLAPGKFLPVPRG